MRNTNAIPNDEMLHRVLRLNILSSIIAHVGFEANVTNTHCVQHVYVQLVVLHSPVALDKVPRGLVNFST